MSVANQFSLTQTTEAGKPVNMETAVRIAEIMAEASSRLFKVQSEAANQAFAESSRHVTTILSTLTTRDSAKLLAEWSSLYQGNMRRVLEVTRSCFEILPQAQTEIAKLVGNPFESANQETQQYLDQFTKALNDGRDAVAAGAKSAVKTSPGISGTQPGNKEKVA